MSLDQKTICWLRENAVGDMRGKTVVITGATGGIGLKMTEIMCFLGAHVIMACRNARKAETAKAALRKEYPAAEISVRLLDLADLESVRAFAQGLLDDHADIHAFVNNAGTFRGNGADSRQGIELVMATNYYSVYALSEWLLPHLAKAGHEVLYLNTLSVSVHVARVEKDLPFVPASVSDLNLYACSKLFLGRYSRALAKRYSDTNVRVCMIHPGVCITPLITDNYPAPVAALASALRGLFNSPEKAALTLPYCLAKSPEQGSLIGPGGCFGIAGFPKTAALPACLDRDADELLSMTLKRMKKLVG